MTVQLQLPYAFRELRTPSRHKAYHGGRGGAKSHSFGQELITRGFERRELRTLCGREIQKSIASSVKRLLEDKIKLARLGDKADGGNGFYNITERSITGGDGSVEFLFAGLRTNPDNIKSMEGLDIAWVEEANTVSQRSVDLLIPTVRKPNSEIWWSWNRRLTTDPVDNMFLGGKPPPRSIIRQVTWEDNPWFPEVLKTDMQGDKERDYDKYLHIWEGQPIVRSEARVFQNWRIEDIDLLVPDGCVPRVGMDFGFSIDPSCAIECYVWEKTLYFRRECHKVKATIDELPSLFAGTDPKGRWPNKFGHLGLDSIRQGARVVADSSRPDTIRYLKDRGFNIVGAKKGARSVEEGVEFIKGYDVVIHPDCINTIYEFTHYSYKEDPLTDEVLPELKDKNNHIIDSARYALENVRKALHGGTAMVGPRTVKQTL